MRNDIRELFAKIISENGNHLIKIADIKSTWPDAVGHVMRHGERVQRGVYDITPRDKEAVVKPMKPMKPKEVTVPDISEAVAHKIEVVDNAMGLGCLIPDVDPEYIPFGCYSTIRKVISSNIFAPVYITGDSGNGKTLSVSQACAKEKREAVIINITNETSEEDLIGGYFLESGDMKWRDGPVIVAMRRGAVLVLDEVDQARPSIMALQTIAQGSPYFIKKTNELVRPAPGFCLIATANTKGDGARMDRFVGAQMLNEAFLERFNIIFEQEYPTEAIERRILGNHTTDTNLIIKLTRFAKITRTAMNAGSIDSCIATRRLVQICKNIEILGNEKVGLTMALNRFDTETRDAFLELYTKLEAELEEDGDVAPSTSPAPSTPW